MEVLPYLVSAKYLSRRWFYVGHRIYVYTHDLLAVIVGLGVSHPILDLFVESRASFPIVDESNSRENPLDLGSLLLWIALVAAALWILLKIAIVREDGEKRALLAKSCRRQFLGYQRKLRSILSHSNPMPELNRLMEQSIEPTVDRNIQEGSWPWPGPSEGRGVKRKVQSLLEELCRDFGSRWIEKLDTQSSTDQR